jgi:hypothetical protein
METIMTANTSAGTTLAISAGNPATFDVTGFAALTFTPIGEITSIDGNVGRSYNLVTHSPLATRATRKKKGSFNSGQVTIPLAIDRDDAGQVLANTALNSDNDYSFVITEQDGTKVYYRGLVMSFPTSYGGVDALTTGTITIEITADDDGEDFVVDDA